MNKIVEKFAEYFKHWNIYLPEEDLQLHRPGNIHAAGWTIQYLFGSDGTGEYLECYAAHRMTNDRHVRIHANGQVDELEAIRDFLIYPAASTKEEQKMIEEQYFRDNQRVSEELRKKGFL